MQLYNKNVLTQRSKSFLHRNQVLLIPVQWFPSISFWKYNHGTWWHHSISHVTATQHACISDPEQRRRLTVLNQGQITHHGRTKQPSKLKQASELLLHEQLGKWSFLPIRGWLNLFERNYVIWEKKMSTCMCLHAFARALSCLFVFFSHEVSVRQGELSNTCRQKCWEWKWRHKING